MGKVLCRERPFPTGSSPIQNRDATRREYCSGSSLNIGLQHGVVSAPHFEAMGLSIRLYLWCVWRQTKRNGLVFGGSPVTYQRIKKDVDYPERTLKRWLSILRREGYVEVTYLNYKMMRIRVLKAKKYSAKQLPLPMPESATVGPCSVPEVAYSRTKVGLSKQTLTLEQDKPEHIESTPTVPDGIAGLVPLPLWLDFVAMRKEIRKPLTSRAVDLFGRKLREMQIEGQDPIAVIEQSILNSWAGIFPVKGIGNAKFESTHERRSRTSAEAIRDVLGSPGGMAGPVRRALPPAHE